MVRYENDCVDCGIACSQSCRLKSVPHFYCDNCKDEADELYEFDGYQLCPECVLKGLKKVEI